ncbi:MAG: 3',5'-cyclic-AMP phosphodiesterase [Candidatus Methylumidiphilus sp.]
MNPASLAAQPIRIVQITDFHLLSDPGRTMMGIDTERSFLAVLEHAWRNHGGTAFFLLTGDLVQDASAATYRRLRGHLEMLPLPCYCLPGNHDLPEMIQQALVGDNIASVPQILLDGWQIVCLDSTLPNDPCGYLADEQMRLLEEKLSAEPERHALVTLHHSPLPTGADWLDTMRLANHEAFFALLRRFPQVKAVVYGHIHQAMEVWHDGLLLLGCPPTCFQFKPDSVHFALDCLPQGYRWLDLYPDGSIKTAVVRLDAVPDGLDMASGGY